mmetsp:Transcript_37226/g.43302  ORF Transcript_37226/g.43302 Transcript_37226/m.43302 type:complete len:105 (-) Transcript_37226:54-368(-)
MPKRLLERIESFWMKWETHIPVVLARKQTGLDRTVRVTLIAGIFGLVPFLRLLGQQWHHLFPCQTQLVNESLKPFLLLVLTDSCAAILFQPITIIVHTRLGTNG